MNLKTNDHPLPKMFVVERERVSRGEDDFNRPVRYMDHRDPVVLHTDGAVDVGWVFQTYVDPDLALERAIEGAAQATFTSREYDGLLAGTLACSRILADKKQLVRLAHAYKQATNSVPTRWTDALFLGRKARVADRSCMNRSTMSVYSGPLFPVPSAKGGRWYQGFDGDAGGTGSGGWEVSGGRRSGWLLTGDAVLGDVHVAERLASFFAGGAVDWLAQVEVLTIPHHGSEANFSDALLRRLGVPPIAVVPAGAKTHYRHPSDGVIEAIRTHGAAVVHTHAKCESGFLHHISI